MRALERACDSLPGTADAWVRRLRTHRRRTSDALGRAWRDRLGITLPANGWASGSDGQQPRTALVSGRVCGRRGSKIGPAIGVINVLGSLFLHPATSMFEVIDELVEEARKETPVVLVDVHAEATSEKAALARWLDGRVTAVVGTHTHVQTSDATVLPKGTAFITDAGMTGPHDSVIGVEAELAIRRMRTGLPVRFETAQGGVRIEGAVVDCDAETGRASSIESLRVPVS